MKSVVAVFRESRRDGTRLKRIQHLWTRTPLEMSRRACKIADRKAAQSLRRDKVNNKIAKEIAKAAREGGVNTTSNIQLAALLQRARELNVSKEIIDRNMKRAKDSDQQSFSEITYEVYGFGGVGIVVEVLTDNSNRSSCHVKEVVKKCRAKMADAGSVLFNFRRAGVISIKSSGVNSDVLFLASTEAGAEDFIEPPAEDETAADDRVFKVITDVEDYARVRSKLQEAGFDVCGDHSGLELVPNERVEVDDEAMELNRDLIHRLLHLNDVDAVYSTQNTSF